ISKDGGPRLPLVSAQKQRLEVVAIENVITQHQGRRGVVDEIRPDRKRLGQPVRASLHGVRKVDPPTATITQKLLEARGVLWGRDNQDVANAGQQQSTERVVDHRLVVHRQQLLRYRQR